MEGRASASETENVDGVCEGLGVIFEINGRSLNKIERNTTLFVVFFFAMFLTRHDILTNVSWANAVLFISDAMGLAVFTILGIRFVQERIGNDNFALLLFVGVITGVGGGLLRDIFAGNVPYIFRKHIYATASIFGALMYLWLDKILSELWAVFFSMVCIIVVRILASHFKWNLPRVEILEKAK